MVSPYRSVQQGNGRDSPLPSSVKDPADDTMDHSLVEAAVDRPVAKMEEALGSGSSLTSELTLDSNGGDVEGLCDWSDLTDYLFPAPPQRATKFLRDLWVRGLTSARW